VSKLHPKTKKVVPDAPSVAALKRILEAELHPIHQALIELSAELRPATQRTNTDSLDPRKMFIAGIIASRPPFPKMSVPEIFREANRLQDLDPNIAHRRPVPDWEVDVWTEMKGSKRAQTWIAKIRADPRYLPYEYLTPKGKERFRMNRG